jgi:hypothetical protein
MSLTKALSVIQKGQAVLINLPAVGGVVDLTLASIPSVLRFGSGNLAPSNLSACTRPKKRLILYEFEACPFCRKVRESASALGLELHVKPTPRETLTEYGFSSKSRFRPEVKNHPKGGALRFPFLIDENTDTAMYESDLICDVSSELQNPNSPRLVDIL